MRGAGLAWDSTPENVANLKKHLVQFIALATGGPAQYDGKEMKSAHDGMRIGNPEFDAALGDLKASLDKLQIPNKEQKDSRHHREYPPSNRHRKVGREHSGPRNQAKVLDDAWRSCTRSDAADCDQRRFTAMQRSILLPTGSDA